MQTEYRYSHARTTVATRGLFFEDAGKTTLDFGTQE